MNERPSVTYRGISFWGVLVVAATAIFVVLKLLGKIAWSWWWVLSPLWISAIVWVIVVIILSIIFTYLSN